MKLSERDPHVRQRPDESSSALNHLNDMVVGDDVAAFVNDEPGADPSPAALLGRYLLAERVHPIEKKNGRKLQIDSLWVDCYNSFKHAPGLASQGMDRSN